MGQNVFGNVNGFGNPVEERKRKAQAGVQQNGGFGIATTPSSPSGSGGATLPNPAPDNGLGQAITSPAPQYAPSGGGDASGAMPKTSTGFDPSGHPDLHGHAQESWKSHGIDFDGLLKAGIANSASGSALSRDLFQRDHAADLNLKYIQGANAQMQPKSVERNQDIDLLHTLASQMATVMPTMQGPVGRDGKATSIANPQYHQLQANYNQLLQKLGLIGTSTGFGGQASAGGNPGNPTGGGVSGVSGAEGGDSSAGSPPTSFGNKVHGFLRAAAPAAAGVGVGRAVTAGLGATGVGLPFAIPLGAVAGVGAYKGADALLDKYDPSGQQAMHDNPVSTGFGSLAAGIGAMRVGGKAPPTSGATPPINPNTSGGVKINPNFNAQGGIPPRPPFVAPPIGGNNSGFGGGPAVQPGVQGPMAPQGPTTGFGNMLPQPSATSAALPPTQAATTIKPKAKVKKP